jgi:hypothetical protein
MKNKKEQIVFDSLKKLGYIKEAEKVVSNPSCHAEIAAWAEDINLHGIAAILRAEEHEDLETLIHCEQAHNDFDLGGRHEQYHCEREDMLSARYAATNPDARLNDHSARERDIDALRYLYVNNLKTPTYNRLVKKIKNSPEKYSRYFNELQQQELHIFLDYQPNTFEKHKSEEGSFEYTEELHNALAEGAISAYKATIKLGSILGFS